MTPASGGTDLLAWRQKVMPWVMAVLRLGVGWFVTQASLLALLQKDSLLRAAAGTPQRTTIAALYIVGLALFAWPATCLIGFAVLLLAVGGFEWLWTRTGMGSGPLPLSIIAVLGVLAFGEWLTRRVQRHPSQD